MTDWLQRQLDSAAAEVASWPEWKRQRMRALAGGRPMEPNMWQRIRAAALREAADLCNTRASVEGIAQACADDIRALRDKPAAICPRCGATDCVGCLTSNPKASAEDYTTVAELDRWIEEATHYTIKTPAAERHLQLIIRARDELQELEYIFELQRSRMGEATKFWQEATQQPDIWPDLGKLLEWLCNEIVLLTDAVKAESDKALGFIQEKTI